MLIDMGPFFFFRQSHSYHGQTQDDWQRSNDETKYLPLDQGSDDVSNHNTKREKRSCKRA